MKYALSFKFASSYHNFAFREFVAAGWCNKEGMFEDEMQHAICKHILELLDVFEEEGHSGSTAPYTIGLFSKLAMFKPLVPLLGTDEEWVHVSTDSETGVLLYQNKRNSAVFKDSTGDAWFIDGRIFREENGSCFTNKKSSVPVTFPCYPESVYVDITKEQYESDTYQ